MHKKIIQLLAILVLAPLAFSALAQPARFVEGTHYVVLPAPVKTNDPAKIEVLEVFWYGCSHCFRFEALNVLEQVHSPMFDAINVQGNRLQNEQQLSAFFVQYGVTAEQFSTAFNSFSVRTKVNQAEAKMREYQVRSTPNMVVNGKYLISTGEAVPTQQEMLEVVNFLVEKERSSS